LWAIILRPRIKATSSMLVCGSFNLGVQGWASRTAFCNCVLFCNQNRCGGPRNLCGTLRGPLEGSFPSVCVNYICSVRSHPEFLYFFSRSLEADFLGCYDYDCKCFCYPYFQPRTRDDDATLGPFANPVGFKGITSTEVHVLLSNFCPGRGLVTGAIIYCMI
jgi:hypothetical protein